MLPLIAALAIASATPLQDKAYVGYSGIPLILSTNVAIESHNVTLTVFQDHVDVSSVTLVKNNGAAGSFEVDVPTGSVRQAPAPRGITATWANSTVDLKPMDGPNHPLGATVQVRDHGSYALRIGYSEPIGHCGMDHLKLLAAYSLRSSVPIGTLMVTYAYAPGVVFHLPEVGPGPGWQVGLKGAFLKQTNYDGNKDLSYCAFFPGGFGS